MADGSDRRRYRGILTPNDRDALGDLGGREPVQPPDGDALRHTRYRIRERLERAIRDLSFLFYHLPTRDRKQAFEEFVSGPGRDQLLNVFELFLLGIHDNATAFEPEYGDDVDDPHEIIAWFVQQGIGGLEWELGGYQSDVEVEVEVDRWRPDPEAAYDRFLSGYATNVDLAYLSHWCDDVDVLEHVIESGESYRIVKGPASKFGSECVTEFTPQHARWWLDDDDDSTAADDGDGADATG